MILRNILLTGFTGFLMASGISGCGDDDDSSAEKFIADYCTLTASCCETWGSTNDNGARCREVFGAFGAYGTVNQSAADQCLAQMRQDQAAGILCEGKPSTPAESDPCQKVFVSDEENGTTPAGGKCQFEDDCAAPAGGTATCAMTSGGGDDYCRVIMFGKEGDGPCTTNIYANGGTMTYGTGDKLTETIGCREVDGLYCDTSGGQACKKFAEIGSPCTGYGTCVPGSYCSSSKCVANLKEGETCDDFSDNCDTGLYCETTTKACAKQKHVGEPCTSMNECSGGSCDEGKCGAGLGGGFAGMLFCPGN